MKKIAIVLDSSVFGDKKYYDFRNVRINSFAKSIKSCKNLDLFIPSIVVREIKKHIKESIEKDKTIEKSGYFKEEIKPELFKDIENKIILRLDDFIINNEIKIIDCDEYANIKEVNDWYFNKEKPFEDSKPKEFPDALIVSAIINYFNKNKYDKHYIISSDNGFKEGIELHSKLKTYHNTAQVTKEILNYEESDIYKIIRYLKENDCIAQEDCFNYCSFDSGDIVDVIIKDSNISSVEILNVDETEDIINTIIEVNCDVTLTGDLVLLDPYESIYDREDQEYAYKIYRQANELCINNISTFISLTNKKGEEYKNHKIIERGNVELVDYLNQMKKYDEFYY